MHAPETMTDANRNVVMPPNTQSGIVVMNAATLLKIPSRNSHPVTHKNHQQCTILHTTLYIG